MIDAIDRKILNILQADGRAANSEIARRVRLAPSAVFERIRKLEERELIRGYTAILDPAALGLGLVAFVFVRADDGVGNTRAAKILAKAPEVLEVHHVAGEDCFLVKVRAADTGDLSRILRERFGSIKSIRSTRTTIVLSSVKESSALDIASEPGSGDSAADD
jgi:Lrp/AsnC family leucine-responsive transcriptional regulator